MHFQEGEEASSLSDPMVEPPVSLMLSLVVGISSRMRLQLSTESPYIVPVGCTVFCY